MTNNSRNHRRSLADAEMVAFMLTLPPCHHPTLDTIRGAVDHYGCTIGAAGRAYQRVTSAGLIRQVKVRHGLYTILYKWEAPHVVVSPAPAPSAHPRPTTDAPAPAAGAQLLLDLR